MIIGNIGVGLFILIIVWLIALIVFVIGIKYQNNFAWISLSLAVSLTIILIIIPVEKKEQDPEPPNNLPQDYQHIYQIILLIFISLSALVGFIIYFISHCVETIHPKPIKQF